MSSNSYSHSIIRFPQTGIFSKETAQRPICCARVPSVAQRQSLGTGPRERRSSQPVFPLGKEINRQFAGNAHWAEPAPLFVIGRAQSTKVKLCFLPQGKPQLVFSLGKKIQFHFGGLGRALSTKESCISSRSRLYHLGVSQAQKVR